MSYGTYKKLTIASFVVWLFINLLCLLGCNSNRSIGAVNSPNKEFLVTKKNVTNRLQETAIDYHVIDCGVYGSFIVMEKGARILGPFSKDTGESFSWLNQAWKDSKSFTELVNDNAWNYGGCRIWLGPELEYNIQDDKDFWNTYVVPPEIDPGNFQLTEQTKNSVQLQAELSLRAHRSEKNRSLSICRNIRRADNPMRYLPEDRKSLADQTFIGYEETISLQCQDHDLNVPIGIWNLLQVTSSGKAIVPCTPSVRVTDYFEPITEEYIETGPEKVVLTIDGKKRYKIGLSAVGIFDRIGYLQNLDAGQARLLIRNFTNVPSAAYLDTPPNPKSPYGDLLQFYNDSGDLGGFGEIEIHSPTVGIDGLCDVVMHLQSLWFEGAEDKIKEIATTLLGAI